MGAPSGKARGALGEAQEPATMMAQLSPFVILLVFQAVQRPGTPRIRGSTLTGYFLYFKLEEMTPDSRALGPVSPDTHAQ